jgi:hypothetical protein
MSTQTLPASEAPIVAAVAGKLLIHGVPVCPVCLEDTGSAHCCTEAPMNLMVDPQSTTPIQLGTERGGVWHTPTLGWGWTCSACGEWHADQPDPGHALIAMRVHQHRACPARVDGDADSGDLPGWTPGDELAAWTHDDELAPSHPGPNPEAAGGYAVAGNPARRRSPC